MTKEETKVSLSLQDLVKEACQKIAPVWPLENFVAVNPYLGLIDQPFVKVAHKLADLANIQTTLPASFYLDKVKEGKITMQDLEEALGKSKSLSTAEGFVQSMEETDEKTAYINTPSVLLVSEVAGGTTGKDWDHFMITRISNWAASYFDLGQASWSTANQQVGPFASWREEAIIDRAPELTGLKNFRKVVKTFPADYQKATEMALEKLGIPQESLLEYLHRLLLKTGGWSAHAARLDWEGRLYGTKTDSLQEFLAILLCWEASVLQCLPELSDIWRKAKNTMSVLPEKEINTHLANKLVLQEALDQATQRRILEKFKAKGPAQKGSPATVKAQAVFCIDVRSEAYRRNLELADPQIETMGFAGFFAFPINYVPLGHENGSAQCPVLLKTGPTIKETLTDEKEVASEIANRKLNYQLKNTWSAFKSGAVTCFSFVSPMGLSFLVKLFTDAFGITRPVPHPDQAGLKKGTQSKKTVTLHAAHNHGAHTGIELTQQVQMAKNALKAMSLTEGFAPFVLVVGHGSTSVNNPHATGLDCGACGGHTGESNAKVAAAVLNNTEVRAQLKNEGIEIPEQTVFLACLHDTTTDEVTVYHEEGLPNDRVSSLVEIKQSLAKAGITCRIERSLRMNIGAHENTDDLVKFRSKDWSQVRPEWGLAGCSAFVVAPRERTLGLDLEGRSFLHSYDWKKDQGFGVLELIMTAPMVVTSWINLQYFASTVDNVHFGSGNKTLHNVTAGLGVLEGFSGDLRVGLPMQSVHDGEKFQHEPARLNIIIEAPIEAMNEIISKHEMVRNLCDNEWIYLLAMDEQGNVSKRYAGNLTWKNI